MSAIKTIRSVRSGFNWAVRQWGVCVAVALAMAYASSSRAQLIIDGPTISLASLTNGETLIVGDKAFTGFSLNSLDFQAGSIGITPITENGNFGIRISGGFTSGGAAEDFILNYQVSVTNSANLISAANLSFNGNVTFGTGLAEVVEDVMTNNLFAGQMFVFASIATNKLSDSLAIVPPQPLLTLTKDVIVQATLPAFSSISFIDQTFTQVPEPSALALVAAGFTGLALLRRRRH